MLLARWKGQSETWAPLRLTKDIYPIKAVESVKGNRIDDDAEKGKQTKVIIF